MTPARFVFVCVENAGRSQMAQAFLRRHAPGAVSLSAGTRPAGEVNPVVVEVMREVGIDISGNRPGLLSDGVAAGSTLVNMGCMDGGECPALLHRGAVEWDIPDPRGRPIEEVRRIRDLVESKVRDLVGSGAGDPAPPRGGRAAARGR